MKANKFLNFTQITVLLCMLFLGISCVSTGYGTTFTASKSDERYKEKMPCNVTFVVAVNIETLNEYEFIGYCKSKRPSGHTNGYKNNAVKEIKECACKNGGDLVRIIYEESTTEHPRNIEEAIISGERKKIDTIEGEVYRAKSK